MRNSRTVLPVTTKTSKRTAGTASGKATGRKGTAGKPPGRTAAKLAAPKKAGGLAKAAAPKKATAKKTASKPARPRRPLRVVVMMSDEEHGRLLSLCEDDVRPVASWFRVVVRRAWESRRPRRSPPATFQRQETDGLRRRVEVWTRLSDEERDQLEVLATDEGVSVAVWYRKQLRDSRPATGRGARTLSVAKR